ncbi:MAG TPA: adenylate/guanylate cyclase domain-containing protein [Candidatus Ozemobacteraceae bacterium]|nr:adenylate/guanylate cyclase domain-containing protein [Candidatus Ozemobacteraceae bacterium]
MTQIRDTGINASSPVNTDETGSLLIKLFLFATIIILPLTIAAFAFRTMYLEEFTAEKALLKQKLSFQSGMVTRVARPEYQIRRLTERLIEKGIVHAPTERITRFVDGLERRFPGAFKWVIWDESGRLRNVQSPAMLKGQKTWEAAIHMFLDQMQLLSTRTGSALPLQSQISLAENPAIWSLQRALGPSLKVEHLTSAHKQVIPGMWLGERCQIIWTVEAEEYAVSGAPVKSRGGFLLMVFPEKLPTDFWLKAFIAARPNQRKQIPFPVMALSLRNPSEFYLDPALRNRPQCGPKILSAYLDRAEEVFTTDRWLCHGMILDEDSPIRVVSVADLTRQQVSLEKNLFRLYLVLALLLLVSAMAAASGKVTIEFPLRVRITGFFVIAILLPVTGIIAIGQSFVTHEETRLRDEARKDMRQTINALDLRYRDISRLMERTIYTRLTELIGTETKSIATIEEALKQAESEELISNYFISDEKGVLVKHDMANIDLALGAAIKIGMKQVVKFESKAAQGVSLIDAAQDELAAFQSAGIAVGFDFFRPSHLRYYCFGDNHLYVMSIRAIVAGTARGIFVSSPSQFIERYFAHREFLSGRHARALSESRYSSNELFFYARLPRFKHMPEEIPMWKMLDKNFKRAGALNVQEEGEVIIDGESFLYLISPLPSMTTRAYIPCVLTAVQPIINRCQELRQFLLVMVALALISAVALGGALAGSLLVPIRRMDKAVQRVGAGNLEVQLPVTTQDEFGRLSGTFNAMVQGLRERERMRAYVSETVLEAVRDNSASRTIEGEFLEASILFSDIRGFTTLSEQHPPKEIFAMLNAFMSEVEPIIRLNDGRVDKFIGDAVMAIFHAGKQHHAIRAVMAAVSMMLFLDEFNTSREAQGLFTIKIGIGINTGRVMLGDVGSANRKDLTVIGDEVNLASRLETASKKGRHSRIILSESTFTAVSGLVEVEEMPFTEVKGKQQPVRMFELIRLRPLSEARHT